MSCPAARHLMSYRAWRIDGRMCTCPRVIAYVSAIENARRARRQAHAARTRGRGRPPLSIDLRRADRRDVDAIVNGYRLWNVDTHTLAAAVAVLRARGLTIAETARRLAVDDSTVTRHMRALAGKRSALARGVLIR